MSMNTTDTTPLAHRLVIAFARWAYWPADPRQRAPLYLTALALLAVACADQTTRASSGPAAFLIYWPVAVFLITPIVRAAQIALTTPLYRGQRPRGLRLVPLLVAGWLCLHVIGEYTHTLSIADLDGTLAPVDLPLVALLAGVPIAHTIITGAHPQTRNYLDEFRTWIGSTPLFGGTAPPQPGPNPYEQPEQNIPWETNETAQTPPIPDNLAWAYGVLDLPQTATLAEAQTAYRHLAKERHPDQATDPTDRIKREERMTRLNAAWELIEKHHGTA